jgi:hypothetical protein
MKVGFFKRTGSYILDVVPLFLLITATLTWFVGDIIENSIDDYSRLEAIYNDRLEEQVEISSGYYEQLEEDIITEEEYGELISELQNTFLHNNEYLINVVIYQYWYTAVAYVLITFFLLYLTYMIVMKGNTLGRTLMQIELQGKVTWYNIILREFCWKFLFWCGTLSIGLAIDIGLIAFSKKKRTLRDYFSHTYLAPKGVNYPF